MIVFFSNEVLILMIFLCPTRESISGHRSSGLIELTQVNEIFVFYKKVKMIQFFLKKEDN